MGRKVTMRWAIGDEKSVREFTEALQALAGNIPRRVREMSTSSMAIYWALVILLGLCSGILYIKMQYCAKIKAL